MVFVTVPRTEILGEPDRYVKAGSNVVLRCIVRGALEPPTFIMWYHGTEQLAADSRRHRTQLDPNLPEASGDGQSTVSSINCSLVDFNLITLDFKFRCPVVPCLPCSVFWPRGHVLRRSASAKLQYYFTPLAFMSHASHAPKDVLKANVVELLQIRADLLADVTRSPVKYLANVSPHLS